MVACRETIKGKGFQVERSHNLQSYCLLRGNAICRILVFIELASPPLSFSKTISRQVLVDRAAS